MMGDIEDDPLYLLDAEDDFSAILRSINSYEMYSTLEQQTLHEGKLYLRIDSAQELVKVRRGKCIKRPVYCEVEVDHQIKAFYFSNQTDPSNPKHTTIAKSSTHSCWDIFEYYGPRKIKFLLWERTLLSKKLIGRTEIMLSELSRLQSARSAELINQHSSDAHVWDCKSSVVIPTNIPMRVGTKNSTWLEAAKSASTFSSSGKNYSVVKQHGNSVEVEHTNTNKYYGITLDFSFRVMLLQSCLDASNITFQGRHISELHFLASYAPASILEQVMLSLAWKNSLMRAVKLQSSDELGVLDLSLWSGNHAAVYSLLSRAGNFCFPRNIVSGKKNSLHFAVLGGSAKCVEYLCRFLRKYSRESMGVQLHSWCPIFESFLESFDENGCTPLALACSMLGRSRIAEQLLVYGANVGVVNELDGNTPLMYACISGQIDVVERLLSIVKSRSEIDEALRLSSSHGSSGVLQTHLRLDQRSRNILRGFDHSKGGFFNKLNLYSCCPIARNKEGKQAIHIAAIIGRTDIVQSLLKIDVPVSEEDSEGNNLFHISAGKNDMNMVLALIEYEKRSWVTYQRLIQNKSHELMIYRKKSLVCLNLKGESPISICERLGHLELAKVLVDSAISVYGSYGLTSGSGKSQSELSLKPSTGYLQFFTSQQKFEEMLQLSEEDMADADEFAFALTTLALKRMGREIPDSTVTEHSNSIALDIAAVKNGSDELASPRDKRNGEESL